MGTTIKKTITITPTHLDKARKDSVKVFGKENVSGFIGYLIEGFKAKTK